MGFENLLVFIYSNVKTRPNISRIQSCIMFKDWYKINLSWFNNHLIVQFNTFLYIYIFFWFHLYY